MANEHSISGHGQMQIKTISHPLGRVAWKSPVINVGREVEKWEPLYTADGKWKWFGCFEEQYSIFLKRLSIEFHMTEQFSPRYLPKRNENTGLHRMCTQMSTAAFIIAKTTHISISWWVDKQNVVYPENGIWIIQWGKGREPWHLLQHGWTSKALCWVKGGDRKTQMGGESKQVKSHTGRYTGTKSKLTAAQCWGGSGIKVGSLKVMGFFLGL